MMPINNAINLAYQKEQLDLYAKKIMADDQIIKVLLKNAVSDLFPQQVEITIRNMLISKVPVDPGYTNRISVKQQENFIPSEGRIVFDLLFETQLQSNKTITVNVEIQKNFHLKYPPACREEFYLARQISAQAGVWKDSSCDWHLAVPECAKEIQQYHHQMPERTQNHGGIRTAKNG